MEISYFQAKKIKMYTFGKEDAYKGTSIVYNNRTKTLVYYYYENHKRLYIIDGTRKDARLPYIMDGVRVVAVYCDAAAARFDRHFRDEFKRKRIFYFNDDFFRYLSFFLLKKNYIYYSMRLFNIHKQQAEKNRFLDERTGKKGES